MARTKFTRDEVIDTLDENEVIRAANRAGLFVETADEREARHNRERERVEREMARDKENRDYNHKLFLRSLESQAEAAAAREEAAAHTAAYEVGFAEHENGERRVALPIHQSNKDDTIFHETTIVLDVAETLALIFDLDSTASRILLETDPEGCEDRVLRLRRQHGISLRDVADRLHLSREEVRQMEARAIRREREREGNPLITVDGGSGGSGVPFDDIFGPPPEGVDVIQAAGRVNDDGTIIFIEGGDDLPPELRSVLEEIASDLRKIFADAD